MVMNCMVVLKIYRATSMLSINLELALFVSVTVMPGNVMLGKFRVYMGIMSSDELNWITAVYCSIGFMSFV